MSSRKTQPRRFERPQWDFRTQDRNIDELPVRKLTEPDFNEKSVVNLVRETVEKPKSIPTVWARNLADSRISFNEETPVFIVGILVVVISIAVFLIAN
jgi:hypothetical protein